MKNFPLLFCLVLIFTSSIFAQANQSLDCPTVDVAGGGIIDPDEPLTFTAKVVDPKNRPHKYVWTVSRGMILSGQGTPTISVKIQDNNESITATVEIRGIEGCFLAASETGSTVYHPPTRLFDEYGALTDEDLKARLQNIFIELGGFPGAHGYMIIYGTRRQIARRKKMFLDGMIFYKLDASRLTMIDGGANPFGKGIWTKVWIVPPGADNPEP